MEKYGVVQKPVTGKAKHFGSSEITSEFPALVWDAEKKELPKEETSQDQPKTDSAVRPFSVQQWLDEALLRLENITLAPKLLLLFALAVVVAGLWWMTTQNAPAKVPIEELIPQAQVATAVDTTSLPATVRVHIVGAVQTSGVIETTSDAIVLDVVRLAGGFTDDADKNQLNLAAQVVDGSQLYVPKVGEEIPASFVQQAAPLAGETPIAINSATAQQLEALPGIGPAMSQAIVDYRTENGEFSTVEQLLDVPGIGPAKLEKMRDSIRL